MERIYQVLEAMEVACESDEALTTTYLPEFNDVLGEIALLPLEQREALKDRLERISMIIEGKMMLLAEELEKLRGQIQNVQMNNTGTQAYRRVVAVIPVNPDAKAANS